MVLRGGSGVFDRPFAVTRGYILTSLKNVLTPGAFALSWRFSRTIGTLLFFPSIGSVVSLGLRFFYFMPGFFSP